MDTCLGDLQLNWCLIYLNDVKVFSKNAKRALDPVDSCLHEAEWAVLKLKPSKCEFFKKSLTYLGHRISEVGIETDDSKIKVIQE